MYIGDTGRTGLFVLVREVLDNALMKRWLAMLMTSLLSFCPTA
jgi:DNA gyrase/topoisomerase IV subunit B